MNRYYERKSKGLCPDCEAPVTQYVFCDACRERRNNYFRRHYDKMKELGICVVCGTNVAPHGTVCRECAYMKAERKRYYDSEQISGAGTENQ